MCGYYSRAATNRGAASIQCTYIIIILPQLNGGIQCRMLIIPVLNWCMKMIV